MTNMVVPQRSRSAFSLARSTGFSRYCSTVLRPVRMSTVACIPGMTLRFRSPRTVTALRRAHSHQVVAFRRRARTIVDDRIGADVLDPAGETAVDREVIGRQLDHRVEAGPHEGDVARPHARLDQQRVLERHDLDEIHAGLHDATDRADLDLLDRPCHGRTHRGTRETILERDLEALTIDCSARASLNSRLAAARNSADDLLRLLLAFG